MPTILHSRQLPFGVSLCLSFTVLRFHEPQFFRIAEEFLKYLDDERGEVADDPVFLRELAHYEWVELALSISQEELTPELADPNGDLSPHDAEPVP